MTLQAPFPWFGGKRLVAAEVWRRFGAVDNYVEPFFGSGAVLLARPGGAGKVETINDACGFVANFWRAVQAEPEAVAAVADWPVNERDLEARHYWLVTEGRDRLARILGDPRGYDVEVAGWWVWGCSAWIGSGWCRGDGPWAWTGEAWAKRDAGRGVHRQLPHLGAGSRSGGSHKGMGVHRQLPNIGRGGGGGGGSSFRGVHRPEAALVAWFGDLSARLRRVRVACGDWSRVTSDTVTWRQGMTAVFLDPPYGGAERTAGIYAADCGEVAAKARAWAIEAGARPDMRVALCGYDGEHDMPAGWSCHAWKSAGGYGSQGEGRGRANAAREVVWFSPACVAPAQSGLFEGLVA